MKLPKDPTTYKKRLIIAWWLNQAWKEFGSMTPEEIELNVTLITSPVQIEFNRDSGSFFSALYQYQPRLQSTSDSRKVIGDRQEYIIRRVRIKSQRHELTPAKVTGNGHRDESVVLYQ